MSTPEGVRLRRKSLQEREREQLDHDTTVAAEGDAPVLAVKLLKQHAGPILHHANRVIHFIGPLYVQIAFRIVELCRTLPLDIVQALTGLGLCFFGGAYCASIAAVEAFMLVGWATTRSALEDVYEDILLIREASDQDDKQLKEKVPHGAIPSAEYIQRKARLAVLAVRDPEKLSTAVGGLYAGWIAVQGTLRLEFAKTVTLGMSIAAMLDRPALRYGLPILTHACPSEYHRWLPTIIRAFSKSIAVGLAWYLAVAISAFQSALRGGLMFSRALSRWARKRGLMDVEVMPSSRHF